MIASIECYNSINNKRMAPLHTYMKTMAH